MLLPLSLTTVCRSATAALVAVTAAGTLAACGGSDDTAETPAKTVPSETGPAVKLDKKVDTAATAEAADDTKVPADQLEGQIAAIERGLKDAGFNASSYGVVGDAKETIVVDRSWSAYVYESDRAAAEFVLSLEDVLPDSANFELFRIDNRVYYAVMTSALSDDDRAKLDEMAVAAEGAIAASR